VLAALVALLLGAALLGAHLVRGPERGSTAARPAAPHVPRDAPPPAGSVTPASIAGVDFTDGVGGTQLRQVGYDGLAASASWPLRPQPGGLHVVSISPDGQYVVALDSRQNWQVVDASQHVVTTTSNTIDRVALGAWSPDSRHLCALSLGDSAYPWRVLVQDVTDPAAPPVYSPILGLASPPGGILAACDAATGLVVLVTRPPGTSPLDPTVPRDAVTVDLAGGGIVARVPIGDASRGTIFSQDGRYLALVDYATASTSIVSMVTGETVKVVPAEVRGFSGDDALAVENSRFESQTGIDPGTTSIVDWRTGRVRYSRVGWTNGVRTRPGSADLALGVMSRPPADPTDTAGDLVLVPAVGRPAVLAYKTVY
jgi:hypothetical protein